MIVVIQCAAKKNPEAGRLRQSNGQPLAFIADPKTAPLDDAVCYARPDDLAAKGVTWRQHLLDYNQSPSTNPLGLLPAWELYQNRTYGRLVDRLGVKSVFILSAGWGLLASDFLTPAYDITFSPSADNYKRRRKKDHYDDFCMLRSDAAGSLLFFGGKDYVQLFSSLTARSPARRIVFYNSQVPPIAPGCDLRRFRTTTRTNWHYECANAFLNKEISI